MDSAHKQQDKNHTKNRPPSAKLTTSKDPNDRVLRESHRQKSSGIDSRSSGRAGTLQSPEKFNTKPGTSGSSRKNDSASKGKENIYANSLQKKKKNHRVNQSCIDDISFNLDHNNSSIRNSQNLSSINQYATHDVNSSSKPEYKARPASAEKNHKRASSAQGNLRSQSHGRGSTAMSKNNSMLNNSTLIEADVNYSKDYSIIRENANDISHLSGGYGVSSHMKGEDITIDFGKDTIISPGDFSSKIRANKNFFFERGKTLFKDKSYSHALKYLKEAVQSEPDHIEAIYLMGVCYLWMGKFEDAIERFGILLEQYQFFHKNVFILLSIAQKKCNDIPGAIKTLGKAIAKFPKYYDAFIFRGKLYLKEKKWERALFDFKNAIQLNTSKSLGFIGMGDCLRMLGEYDEAINCYSEAMSKEISVLNVALLKRAIAYIELKNYDEALDDLQALISNDPLNSEAFYFKGFILSKKKEYNDAILCFEQAIKHNTTKKAVLKSLYEITKIKIENRDFYEAYHTLHRSELLELDPRIFRKFRLFTEGVIFLMKRKHEEGIESLTAVVKKQTSDFLKSMAYNYRAYGYFCSGKVKKALQDYQDMTKITSKLDKSSTYNKLLCEGILATEAENFDSATQYFEKAQKIYKNKMEPYFYRAVVTITAFKKIGSKSDPLKEKLTAAMTDAFNDLDSALALSDSNANLFYVRSIVLYVMGQFEGALQNIEKAIEKADDNYPKFYYLRGSIYSAAGNYQQALSDLTIAINLDKNFNPAFLERGKCYFTLGDVKQAFVDIQKYISGKPEDPNIHLWAGNLLFNTHAYEDAAKAYSNSENITKSEKLLVLRARCNIILKELNLALSDLNKLIELKTSSTMNYLIDRECLMSLKVSSTVAKDSESLDPENLIEGIQRLAKMISYKSPGDVFKICDLFFYKAVYHFHLGEFEQALSDLDSAWHYKEKELKKKREQRNSGDVHGIIRVLDDFCSDSESEIDRLDKSGSFESREYLYNKAIILLMLNEFDKSYQLLEILLQSVENPEARDKLEFMIEMIATEKSYRDKETPQESPKGDLKAFEIVIFDYYNRLCSIFPSVQLPFTSNKVIYEARLSFCLPTIEPPSLHPQINEDMINEITMASVESRPEAPWIRRNFGGVIFTENFLEREEKEIENLNEVIIKNGLKAEEIYDSLGKTEKSEKTIPNNTEVSRKDLNDAMFIDDSNLKQDKLLEPTEFSSDNLLQNQLKSPEPSLETTQFKKKQFSF